MLHTNIIIHSLYLYPVKSMSGIEVSQIQLDKYGPRYDRNWMVIDENGNAVTQRQNKQLALFKLTITDTFLEFNFLGNLFRLEHLSYINNPLILGKVWTFAEELIDCGEDVAIFLSNCLNQKCRLVKININYSRRSSGENNRPISFVDSRQFLLTSLESLAWLNAKLIANNFGEIPMNRFRPNIVLSGGDSEFYENIWQNILIGNVLLHREKACGRCMIITLNQATAEIADNGPLKILAKYNRDDKNKCAAFGTYFNSACEFGDILVGDKILVEHKR